MLRAALTCNPLIVDSNARVLAAYSALTASTRSAS